MKIWNAFGSEHSMNIVMIGHFKTEVDAEETKRLIDNLCVKLRDEVDVGRGRDRFGEVLLEILKESDCYCLSPTELEHFLYDVSCKVSGDKIHLWTDESEISAFFKLMIQKGAKVEIFSAHDYPEEEK